MCDHANKIAMDQRLAASEDQELHVVACQDLDRSLGIRKGYRVARACRHSIDREIAEIAARIADAGDRKMTRPRPAIDDGFQRHLPQGPPFRFGLSLAERHAVTLPEIDPPHNARCYYQNSR